MEWLIRLIMEIPLFTGNPAKAGKIGLTARAAQFKI